MVELGRLANDLPGRVLAKLEMRNPCGSVKDRVGVALIEDAERQARLRPGMTLVEPTGGNTGIGVASVAAIRGYRLILTMPETMSKERVALLRHLGAEVVLTPGILMADAVARAKQLVKELPGSIMLDQFTNPANAEVHRRTTAVESGTIRMVPLTSSWPLSAPAERSPGSVKSSSSANRACGSWLSSQPGRRSCPVGPRGTTRCQASVSGSSQRS
jgi:hypothetical protein